MKLPSIPDLYKVRKSDFNQICTMLGRAFQQDPIWKEILKNDPEKWPLVFAVPVKYGLRYGSIFAPTKEVSAAAVWLPSSSINMNLWRMLLSGAIPHAMKLGSQIGNQISSVFSIIEKQHFEYLKTNPRFAYLYVLGVDPENQGKGLGSLLVKKMMEALPANIPIYLETETKSNVKFYEKLGFEVLNELMVPLLDKVMWEMEWKNK
ncbi:MAG: GNAT family N-acetyltransferase [Candidatus Thorarchaeota archaeon]